METMRDRERERERNVRFSQERKIIVLINNGGKTRANVLYLGFYAKKSEIKSVFCSNNNELDICIPIMVVSLLHDFKDVFPDNKLSNNVVFMAFIM